MIKLKIFLKHVDPVYWVISALIVIVVVVFGRSYTKLSDKIILLSRENEVQSNELSLLRGNITSSTLSLAEDIKESEAGLASAIEKEKKNVVAIKAQVGGLESQADDISGTVDTLEKLSKTDPELLQKYSKVFFLSENYIPLRLVDIQDKHKYSESRDLEIGFEIKPHLEEMLEEALKENTAIYVSSSYRSFEMQQQLKGEYSVIFGEGTANQFSADQGYSEHQLGTTVDLITPGIGGKLSGFEATSAYQWLLNNAYKYGFILSYPQNNNFYVFEPWHWRFVGKELATQLNSTGQNFYDLEQRELDDYLVNIFD